MKWKPRIRTHSLADLDKTNSFILKEEHWMKKNTNVAKSSLKSLHININQDRIFRFDFPPFSSLMYEHFLWQQRRCFLCFENPCLLLLLSNLFTYLGTNKLFTHENICFFWFQCTMKSGKIGHNLYIKWLHFPLNLKLLSCPHFLVCMQRWQQFEKFLSEKLLHVLSITV